MKWGNTHGNKKKKKIRGVVQKRLEGIKTTCCCRSAIDQEEDEILLAIKKAIILSDRLVKLLSIPFFLQHDID
jgi:hypothetical protein